jgi:hypothetical protein
VSLFLLADPNHAFFKFGSPVIPSGSAANPIVLDHTPQELATLVAQSDDKARRALREINFILKRRRELTRLNNRRVAEINDMKERIQDLEHQIQCLKGVRDVIFCSGFITALHYGQSLYTV